MPAYLVHVLTLSGIYAIISLSYAIPVGYTGLLNLAQVGLLGVGAYAMAILTTRGVSFWIALPLAMLITGIIGFLLALPSRRIKRDYYALVTLGFIFVVQAVALNWSSLTQGPFGISGIRRPVGFVETQSYMLLVAFFLLVTGLFVWRFVHSPFGKALEAVRDDDVVAESLGKRTGKLRVVALTTAAVLVGLAGGLLAPFIQFINPSTFGLDSAVWILSIIVVGGLASFPGTLLGVVVLNLIFEPLRFLNISSALVGPLRQIIFSSLLLLVVMFRPKGLLGRAQLD